MPYVSNFWVGLSHFLVNRFIDEEMPRIEEQLKEFSAIDVLQVTKGRWTKFHLADFVHNRVDFVPVVMEKLWKGSEMDRTIYQHLYSWTDFDEQQAKGATMGADHVMHRKFDFTSTWSRLLAAAFRTELTARIKQTKWYETRIREFRTKGHRITAMHKVMTA